MLDEHGHRSGALNPAQNPETTTKNATFRVRQGEFADK